ncbi:hypothetical protein [Pontibacter fetidus]|uniref:Lipoprotein n=1 Tax=Pontibacter fetidus TaxID=2700082 RepID=A0A6B2HAH7_9BACT|nr:hypothetical protein [Pontibacter fetidus]NDK56692.1 hypothetical protein [Pontibacter fetidus]
MRTFFTKTLAFASAVILLSSCAGSYKSITPENMHYEVKSESNGVVLQYRLGVLGEHGNKKYVKKESKNFIKVAAVKLTNNTANTIDVSNDVKFFSGPNQFSSLEPKLAHARLKQSVPIYLLYTLLTPLRLSETTYVNGIKQETRVIFPVGLIVGPGITLYNMITAGTANNKLLSDLQKYSVLNKQIAPGETLHGIVVIPNGGYNPLSIKVGEEELQTKQ